jgi:hypothetical protein
MLLSQVKGKMQDEAGEKRVLAALDKVMDKIEKNQKEDGSFGGAGWANTLSQSMATKGINWAAQSGYEVNEEVRARVEQYARKQYDGKSGKFSSAKSAGVDLYSSAATLSGMQDSDNTNGDREQQVREQMEKAKDATARKKLQDTLDRYKDNRNDLAAAKKAVVKKLDNKQFISGFGSNGGEEFLSYMNIGESLVVDGGEDWEKWDKEITKNLNRIQNTDGSWTGHHCITGRSFCTSAALLVLMTDRTQVPVAVKVAKR